MTVPDWCSLHTSISAMLILCCALATVRRKGRGTHDPGDDSAAGAANCKTCSHHRDLAAGSDMRTAGILAMFSACGNPVAFTPQYWMEGPPSLQQFVSKLPDGVKPQLIVYNDADHMVEYLEKLPPNERGDLRPEM